MPGSKHLALSLTSCVTLAIYSGSSPRSSQPQAPPAPLSAATVKGSLWQQVLADARVSKSSDKPSSYIIMLGSYDVGKTTVLNQLQALGSIRPLSPVEIYKNTGGVSLIDYACLNERSLEDEEDLTTVDSQRCANVYILQNLELVDRLVELLPADALYHLCFLICLDMKQAWCAMDELGRWMRVAERIFNHLFSLQDVVTQDRLKEKMQRYLMAFRRNTFPHTGLTRALTGAILDLQQFGSTTIAPHALNEELAKTLESSVNLHPKGTLAPPVDSPLPVPVVVVLTRSDAYHQLNTRQNLGQIDIMMAYLRKECLKYNAAIIACNCRDEKNPKNIFLLYRYLMHRLTNCFFKEAPATEDVETFFMPSGCDTEEDVTQAVEQTVAGNFEKPYEAWITRRIEPKKLEDPTNTSAVSIQTKQEFLRYLEDQFPSAVVTAKPGGAGGGDIFSTVLLAGGGTAGSVGRSASLISRSESGRRGTGGGNSSLHPMISVQPTNADMSARATNNDLSYHPSPSSADAPNGSSSASQGDTSGKLHQQGGGLSPSSSSSSNISGAPSTAASLLITPGSTSAGGGGDTSSHLSTSSTGSTIIAPSGRDGYPRGMRSSRLHTHVSGGSMQSSPGVNDGRTRSGVGGGVSSSSSKMMSSANVGGASTSSSSGGGASGMQSFPATSSSSNFQPGGGAGGESASLQNFFQGLLAKSKTKAAPTTPRDRTRARPKAPASGGGGGGDSSSGTSVPTKTTKSSGGADA